VSSSSFISPRSMGFEDGIATRPSNEVSKLGDDDLLVLSGSGCQWYDALFAGRGKEVV